MTGVRRYRAFGRVVECDQALPELPPASPDEEPGLRIRWPYEFEIDGDLQWSVVGRSSPDAPVAAFARAAGVSFMRLGAGVDVRVSAGGTIDVAPGASARDARARHVLLDQALPLALAAAGETVLHASAVLIDDRAVLFVGSAGAGKSTIAAALARDRFAVYADDGVVIEERDGRLTVAPSYPGLRLWPDVADREDFGGVGIETESIDAKRRFVPATAAGARTGSAPLACVYTLAAEDCAVRITPLTRRDGVVELVRHSITAAPGDRAAVRAQLDRLVRWSSRMDLWRLAYRRRFADAGAVAAAIAAHARAERRADLLH